MKVAEKVRLVEVQTKVGSTRHELAAGSETRTRCGRQVVGTVELRPASWISCHRCGNYRTHNHA